MAPEALRATRRALVMTQTQLAAALGLSKRAIAHYELGTRPIPQVVALACLALAAGLALPAQPSSEPSN